MSIFIYIKSNIFYFFIELSAEIVRAVMQYELIVFDIYLYLLLNDEVKGTGEN